MIRIGAGAGFSGDDLRGAREVIDDGVHYLCCEVLAETTLQHMYEARRSQPDAGYATDLEPFAEIVLPAVAQGRTRVITNGGAHNALGARRAVKQVAQGLGVTGIRLAAVTGADLTDAIPRLLEGGERFPHLNDGRDLPSADGLTFAAAYLGAAPIVQALEEGASMIITGRVADAAIFMAPAIFEYGISWDDWTTMGRIAALGHLLECSMQVTGGNFSGPWWNVPGLEAPGFPIAEVEATGEGTITKPGGTGGMVTVDTVKEQLLYEVGDPHRYITPDVVTQLDAVRLVQAGRDRVRVLGGGGTKSTDSYKVIIGRNAGWGASIGMVFTYPGALLKARAAAAALDKRLAEFGIEALEKREEYFGAGASFGEAVAEASCPEIVLRYAIRCATEAEASRLMRAKLSVLGLGTPPGQAMSMLGDRAPWPLTEIWPTLIPKDLVDGNVRVDVEAI